ncbi:hypothetical protein [Nocardioides jiangxiensis]|uniref:WXG100 family type VII secretion target n=1 Tax=Nocardioides jiangxiensis TaxID=3064524 RepID=A0ABT9B3F2_9ACTN|nr:hypothetical protein [Nocardioides sp. WY-20]MDO7867826.1 hypothetical protein [Nocardioides sp. WY-20]
MAFTGMNIEAIKNVATQLTQQSDALNNVISVVDGQIQTAEQNWHGADATAFADEWNSAHKAALQQAATAIGQMATDATNQASQQEATSNA